MKRKAILYGFGSLTACMLSLRIDAQNTTAPLAFDSASVKAARDDAPTGGTGFMIALGKQAPPLGLLTMTSQLAPLLMFAYDVQDEVEARAMRARLPEWAQQNKYTILARPPQTAPTQEQIRQMVRNLLEERFALKAHRESHNGPVKTLTLVRPEATGPGLKAHSALQVCLQHGSTETPTLQGPGSPTLPYCGLELHQTAGGFFHVSMIDVSLPEACTLLGGLGGVLGGRGMDTIVVGTGLQGRWDITLDFLPERNEPASDSTVGQDVSGPTFTNAVEKQLGLRLKKGTGQVEELIIDHIAEPIQD